MNNGLFILFIGITLMFLISEGATAQEGICEGCHEKSLKEWTLGVHSHNDIYCEDCHGGDLAGSTMEDIKDESFIAIPDDINEFCESCHIIELERSVHNETTCYDCHISGHLAKSSSDSEAQTSRKNQISTCGSCHPDAYESYSGSVHGVDVLLKGYSTSATCIDCHGAHSVLAATEIDSLSYPSNIPITCSRCHADEELMSQWYYAKKTTAFDTYKESFHWKALEYGSFSAQCVSCHGYHEILMSDDPRSSVYKDNLAQTCGNEGCHEDVSFNAKINQGFVHDKESLHTKGIVFDKSELDEKSKAYFLGPVDLAWFIAHFFKFLTYAVGSFLIVCVILDASVRIGKKGGKKK